MNITVLIYDSEFEFTVTSTAELWQQLQQHPFLQEQDFCVCHAEDTFHLITEETPWSQLPPVLRVILPAPLTISPRSVAHEWTYLMSAPFPLEVERLKYISWSELNRYLLQYLPTTSEDERNTFLPRWRSLRGIDSALDRAIVQWTLCVLEEWSSPPPEWIHFLMSCGC